MIRSLKLFVFLIFLFITTAAVHGQTFLKQLDLGDFNRQFAIDLQAQNDSIEVTTMTIGNNSTLASTILDANGNIIFEELGDTLVFRYRYKFKVGDSLLVMSYGFLEEFHKPFLSWVKGNKVLDVSTLEIFDNDIYFYNVAGSVVNDNYIILSGTVRDSSLSRGYIVWLDRQTLEVLHTEFADNGVTSIGQLVEVGYQVFGISVDQERDWFLTKFSKNTPMEFVKKVYEGELPNPGFYDRLPLLPGTSPNEVIVGKYDNNNLSFHIRHILEKIVDGEVVWSTDSTLIKYTHLDDLIPFVTRDGDILVSTYASSGDDIERGSTLTPVITKYDALGTILWSKIFKRFGSNDKSLYDGHASIFIETDDHYIFSGSHVISTGVDRPLILKITKDGCLLPDCGPMQVIGYHPKPKNTISSRNIWHVYNTETQERFRYTWIDEYISYIGGTLLRSDEMSGDNWYSTDEYYYSGVWGLRHITTPLEDTFWISLDYEYNYDYAVGDKNNHYFPPDVLNINQEVMHKDTITFLDGRPMRRLEVVCTLDDEVMEEFEPRQWIEHVGDPNDVFNTGGACRSPGHNVVTCFYTDGDLAWTHPEYGDMCAPNSTTDLTQPIDRGILYPNPADDYITITRSYTSIRIVDAAGMPHTTISGSKSKGDVLDISTLSTGLYYLYDAVAPKETVVAFYKR